MHVNAIFAANQPGIHQMALVSVDSVQRPDQELLEQLALGRRIVNMCMFSWLAGGAFHLTEVPLATVFLLGLMLTAIVGTTYITKGLGLSGLRRFSIIAGSSIPIVGLPVMAWLGARARNTLQSAGYQIGMFLSNRSRED